MHPSPAEPLIAPATLRAVAPPEAPYPGSLRQGTPARYAVRAADLPTAVWRAPADGHVLAAVDLDRDEDGVVALLPRLVGRFTPTRVVRTDGERVTAAVSLLRGAVLADELDLTDGRWWLTDALRPVLVPTPGDASWRPQTADHLGELAEGARMPELAAVLERASALLRDEAISGRRCAELEDELFGLADAEPLVERSEAEPATRRHADDEPRMRGGFVATETAGALARLIDPDIARRVVEAVAAVANRRFRRRTAPAEPTKSRGSRRPLLLAVVGVVAATLAVGFAWPEPTGGDGVDTTTAAPAGESVAPGAERPVSVETPVADAEPDQAASEAPGETPQTEAPSVDAQAPALSPGQDAEAAAAIVDALSACVQDAATTCRTDILERPDAVVPPGAASADAERTVSVVDDLGGVVVARAESPGVTPQIVVLVEQDGKWLVRDVYDVADQP